MFFFIGGLSPRVKKLNGPPGVCPRCGAVALCRVRVDHYLSLFFIPFFPVRKGQPELICESCGLEIPESNHQGGSPEDRHSRSGPACPGCGRPLAPEFRFCPFCGRSLN